MRKIGLFKKSVVLGALVLGAAMMSGNAVKVQAAEQVAVEVQENVDVLSASSDLIIPAGTTEIEDNAFYGMSFTGKLVIPEGVISIGDKAFYNCGFSGELVLPESLESIGENAFYGCGFSGDLIIPENVKSIGERAFHGCYSFGDTLTILGENVVLGNEAFGYITKVSVSSGSAKWVSYNYFDDIYIGGTNVEFADDVFGGNVTIHAPYNSTARSYISTFNQEWSIFPYVYTQWEGRYDIEEWNISATTLPMEIGESKALTLNIVPAIAAEQSIYWESSNEEVATVRMV